MEDEGRGSEDDTEEGEGDEGEERGWLVEVRGGGVEDELEEVASAHFEEEKVLRRE